MDASIDSHMVQVYHAWFESASSGCDVYRWLSPDVGEAPSSEVYLMAGAEAGSIIGRAANRFWTFYALAADGVDETPSLIPATHRRFGSRCRGNDAGLRPVVSPRRRWPFADTHRRSVGNDHVQRQRLGPRSGNEPVGSPFSG